MADEPVQPQELMRMAIKDFIIPDELAYLRQESLRPVLFGLTAVLIVGAGVYHFYPFPKIHRRRY